MLLRFVPVEELADGPIVCGEEARGGCLFVWNFSVTRSAVLTEADGRHLTKCVRCSTY